MNEEKATSPLAEKSTSSKSSKVKMLLRKGIIDQKSASVSAVNCSPTDINHATVPHSPVISRSRSDETTYHSIRTTSCSLKKQEDRIDLLTNSPVKGVPADGDSFVENSSSDSDTSLLGSISWISPVKRRHCSKKLDMIIGVEQEMQSINRVSSHRSNSGGTPVGSFNSVYPYLTDECSTPLPEESVMSLSQQLQMTSPTKPTLSCSSTVSSNSSFLETPKHILQCIVSRKATPQLRFDPPLSSPPQDQTHRIQSSPISSTSNNMNMNNGKTNSVMYSSGNKREQQGRSTVPICSTPTHSTTPPSCNSSQSTIQSQQPQQPQQPQYHSQSRQYYPQQQQFSQQSGQSRQQQMQNQYQNQYQNHFQQPRQPRQPMHPHYHPLSQSSTGNGMGLAPRPGLRPINANTHSSQSSQPRPIHQNSPHWDQKQKPSPTLSLPTHFSTTPQSTPYGVRPQSTSIQATPQASRSVRQSPQYGQSSQSISPHNNTAIPSRSHSTSYSIPPTPTPTPITITIPTTTTSNTNIPISHQPTLSPISHHTMLSPSAAACTTSLLKKVEKKDGKSQEVQDNSHSISIPSTEGVEGKERLEIPKASSHGIREETTDALPSLNDCDSDSFVLDKSYLEEVLKIEACFNLSKQTQELTQEEVDFIRAVDELEK